MAQIGQIVYNVQDYVNSGGYISTSNADLKKTISSIDFIPENVDPNDQDAYNQAWDDYKAARIQIFPTRDKDGNEGPPVNLVDRYPSKQFTRLGIQAPPGTRVILNTDKNILIGQNGIYELDEDITITSLSFVQPKQYIKDTAATDAALAQGMKEMNDAEVARATALADLEAKKDTLTTQEYWQKYVDIQNTYDAAYQPALDKFNNGLNGIYKLDPDEPYQDLYNIIIDFVY